MIDIKITKEEALEAYGNKNVSLARALKIKKNNISQWPDGEPIPKVHALMLTYLKPEIFKKKIKYRAPEGPTQERKLEVEEINKGPLIISASTSESGGKE